MANLSKTIAQIEKVLSIPFESAGLTSAQQAQARSNIGAINGDVIAGRWNQLVKNGDFSDGTNGWSSSASSYSAASNVLSITYSGSFQRIVRVDGNFIYNHKYYLSFTAKGTARMKLLIGDTNTANFRGTDTFDGSGEFTTTDAVVLFDVITSLHHISLMSYSAGTAQVKNVMAIDLTAIFGAGNEPSAESFKAMFSADYYPYTSGQFADLLWQNASPASSFASQNITVDLSGYSFVMVIFGGYENVNRISAIARVDEETYSAGVAWNTNRYRMFTPYSNRISFADGNIIGSYGGSPVVTNNACIPQAIYGIR